MYLDLHGYITYNGYCSKTMGQLWDPLSHKYQFNSHMKMVWLQWLPVLTLYGPTFTEASFASTTEV
jgi:hypothetical protein